MPAVIIENPHPGSLRSARALPSSPTLPAGGGRRTSRRREVKRVSARLLLDRAAAFAPVLEAADIVDLAIAHVLEQLAGKRGAPARGAVDQHGLVFRKILVVGRRIRIGAKLEQSARDVNCAGSLAARLHFRTVPNVEEQRIAFGDLLARFGRADLWDRGVGGFHHLLDTECHVLPPKFCLLSLYLQRH